ncbi:uncharacterized protein B0H18DRAFT_890257 [Fomitopsis serialis]|uniref:uncharacterized protein n=1 Tax=Fomitopsis serialis TaxID=139415 RepID=UPI002008B1DA|nr:uncharacterized protein B0H18DRAFT_890257 [Neoantrodia serialis]KAH9912330.1 hypothetical protein B0H18DRAFT_890257 [Neoantrodia serialis]
MCSSCNSGGGVWKCMSCIGYPIFCPTCCLAEHRRTPFHRVEQWNLGGYWEPSWLRQVGVQYSRPPGQRMPPAGGCRGG